MESSKTEVKIAQSGLAYFADLRTGETGALVYMLGSTLLLRYC
jgi:hypothetical protein